MKNMKKRYYSEKNARLSYDNNRKVKMQPLKVIFSAVLIFVVYTILDTNLNPPGWWRFDRLEDKRAILSYVEENYPETTRRTGSKFPFQKPAGPFEHSVMFFELDGVNFNVSAWDGKITGDTYYEAKAEKFIRENFIDSFMDERGISPKIKMSFVIPPEHYGLLQKNILDDLYNFTGSVHITIVQDYIDGVSVPKDVGWFYDFYQYWMKNCDLENCTVSIQYRRNKDYSTNEVSYMISFRKGVKTFSNEDEFYSAFKY